MYKNFIGVVLLMAVMSINTFSMDVADKIVKRNAKTICVFLGSALGNDPVFQRATAELGRVIAERRLHLVYGGADVGLMKVLADSASTHGGKMTGVITTELRDKVAVRDGLDALHITEDMGQRIKKEIEISDLFVACPGGIGTIAELLDTWALKKVNDLEGKPIGILNTNGVFTPFLASLSTLGDSGFITERELAMLEVHEAPDVLIEKLLERFAS